MQNPVLNHPVLMDMASRYGRSVASVIISWAIQEGVVIIPRTSKMEHIDDNSRILTGLSTDNSNNANFSPSLATFLSYRDIAIIRKLDGSLEK
jgi:diketogulonate reductase-like aldo/keto reductase